MRNLADTPHVTVLSRAGAEGTIPESDVIYVGVAPNQYRQVPDLFT
jgi:hypothetical protein